MIYQMMSVNPLDSICNPHVNLSEHKDPVVSPNVVSRPLKILRNLSGLQNQCLNLTCNSGFALGRSALLILGESSVIY